MIYLPYTTPVIINFKFKQTRLCSVKRGCGVSSNIFEEPSRQDVPREGGSRNWVIELSALMENAQADGPN